MRTLKRITTRNVQSHKEVVIDLPETGLIRFSGDNSNGKSVITKITKYLTTAQLGHPKIRASLISNDALAGEVLYEAYDGSSLLCHIQRDAAGTYLELTRPNGEKVCRYASEKGWRPILEEFGLFYNKDLDITLQLVDDDSPMLYLATPPKATFALINSALSDPVADGALERLTEIFNEAQSLKQEQIKQKQVYLSAMEKFEVYDTDELEGIVENIDKYLSVLTGVYTPELPEIPYMHKVQFYNVYTPSIPEIPYMKEVHFYTYYSPQIVEPKYPTLYELYKPAIPNLANVMHDIVEMEKGICPVCGRKMVEGLQHAC